MTHAPQTAEWIAPVLKKGSVSVMTHESFNVDGFDGVFFS